MEGQTILSRVMHDVESQWVEVSRAHGRPADADFLGDIEGADVHGLAQAAGGVRGDMVGLDACGVFAIGHRRDDHIQRGKQLMIAPCDSHGEPNRRVDVGSVHSRQESNEVH